MKVDFIVFRSRLESAVEFETKEAEELQRVSLVVEGVLLNFHTFESNGMRMEL